LLTEYLRRYLWVMVAVVAIMVAIGLIGGAIGWFR
jgi:hypothetical protein